MKKTWLLVVLLWNAGGAIHAQDLVLIAPNGGEALVSGTPLRIAWSYGALPADGTLLIALEGASDFGPIAYRKVGDGSYDWLAGEKMDGTFAQPASDYKIFIELVDNDAAYDVSDAPFAIAAPESVVALMAPNGGEDLAQGGIFDIHWSCAGKEGYVSLTLVWDEQPLGAIAENLPAASLHYRWCVGAPLLNGATYGAGGNYRVEIQWAPSPLLDKRPLEKAGDKAGLSRRTQKNSDRSDNPFGIR